jgi:hypothetical protein
LSEERIHDLHAAFLEYVDDRMRRMLPLEKSEQARERLMGVHKQEPFERFRQMIVSLQTKQRRILIATIEPDSQKMTSKHEKNTHRKSTRKDQSFEMPLPELLISVANSPSAWTQKVCALLEKNRQTRTRDKQGE